MAFKLNRGGKTGKKSGSDVRSKFVKRDNKILEKTYNEREEKSKAGGAGKSAFNQELLEELGISEFKPHEGDNYFELLPVSYDPLIPYYLDCPIHYNVGFAKDAFVCNARFKGGKCYRCEQQNIMYRSIAKGSKVPQEIKDLYPTDRAVYLIWDRTEEFAKNKNPDYKLSIWAAPKTKVHSEIQTKVRDKRTKQTIDVSDVSEGGEGRTIFFEYVKDGDYPTYKGIELMEREEGIPEEILDQLDAFIKAAEEKGFKHSLEMLMYIPTYDEVKESMLTDSDAEEETEEEEKPARREKFSKGEKTKKKIKPEIDPDIEEQLEELKEELAGMSGFKFKKWCKENDFEDCIEMERDEALEVIMEKLYNDAADEIPY
jgi:hypothetical protein